MALSVLVLHAFLRTLNCQMMAFAMSHATLIIDAVPVWNESSVDSCPRGLLKYQTKAPLMKPEAFGPNVFSTLEKKN